MIWPTSMRSGFVMFGLAPITESRVMLKSLAMLVKVSPERTLYAFGRPVTQVSVAFGAGGGMQVELSGIVQLSGICKDWPRIMRFGFVMLLVAAMSQIPELKVCAMVVRVSPDLTV